MKRDVCVLAVLAACVLSSCAPKSTASEARGLTTDELVERGDYLVSSVGMCGDCHTPFLPNGTLDMSKHLVGAELGMAPLAPMPWAPVSPALAGLPEGYTESQLASFLMTGEKAAGGAANPPMPAYRFNETDARAVAAYIASLPKPAD